MAGILNLQTRRIAVRGVMPLAAAMIAIVCGPTPADAALMSNFTVDIAPRARVLDALADLRDGAISQATFNSIKYDEACDNPHLRVQARNKPALMITNTNATSDLTSFTLEIAGSVPYAFGTGDILGDNFLNYIKSTIYTDPGVTIASTSVDNPASPKTLTVNFNGLSNNKKVIFNVDLDTTDPNIFVYPDYRMVLFGAPLEEGDPETTPATASVHFANGTSSPALSFGQACDLQGNMVDYSQTPDYANANIRPYQVMDPIEVATLGIPEPSAAALAIAGLVAFIGCGRKSRRLG